MRVLEGEGEWKGGDETPPLHAPPNTYFWIRPDLVILLSVPVQSLHTRVCLAVLGPASD